MKRITILDVLVWTPLGFIIAPLFYFKKWDVFRVFWHGIAMGLEVVIIVAHFLL